MLHRCDHNSGRGNDFRAMLYFASKASALLPLFARLRSQRGVQEVAKQSNVRESRDYLIDGQTDIPARKLSGMR
jgi:hypothetical protein